LEHPPRSRKLSGDEKYRLRCGRYRVIHEIRNGELIVIVAIARQRSDVYG
jgi:mRNA interferase RelE/StbE